MSDKDEDAIVIATEAKAQAHAAMDFMVKGFERVERTLEALRLENSTQHAEGRRNLQTAVRGLHRRHDEQDTAREKLRDDMNHNLAAMSQGMGTLKEDVDEAVAVAVKENTEGRNKLHARIDKIMLSVVAGLVATVGMSVGAAWWLVTNPGVRLVVP